jgi:ketosteroid isomerase-like protein
MKTYISLGVIGGLFSVAILSMAQTPDAAARAAVDAGNQAWVDGVKTEDIKRIIATYAEDAVDCGPTGECVHGRQQIEQKMTTQLAALGRALTATVKSRGATEQGNFIYEWGQAEATFSGGKNVVDRYLTVWQKQPDGTWKIFRNMVIPDK